MSLSEKFLKIIECRIDDINITKGTLAKRLKVSPPYITKLLKGQNVTLDTVEKLGKALGITFTLIRK